MVLAEAQPRLSLGNAADELSINMSIKAQAGFLQKLDTILYAFVLPRDINGNQGIFELVHIATEVFDEERVKLKEILAFVEALVLGESEKHIRDLMPEFAPVEEVHLSYLLLEGGVLLLLLVEAFKNLRGNHL